MTKTNYRTPFALGAVLQFSTALALATQAGNFNQSFCNVFQTIFLFNWFVWCPRVRDLWGIRNRGVGHRGISKVGDLSSMNRLHNKTSHMVQTCASFVQLHSIFCNHSATHPPITKGWKFYITIFYLLSVLGFSAAYSDAFCLKKMAIKNPYLSIYLCQTLFLFR